MVSRTPLADLILRRMGDLGLSREALGRRLGYENPAKAVGRVYGICDGSAPLSSKSRHVLRLLPEALEADPDVVARVVGETHEILASEALKAAEEHRRLREKEDAAWRASFVSHAILHTERTAPTQICICGTTGGVWRWRGIRLDVSRPPVTFVDQVLAIIPERTRIGPMGERRVMFFGEVLGFLINYDPDRAVRFDLEGVPRETYDKAYRPGEVILSFGGPPVPPANMATVLMIKSD